MSKKHRKVPSMLDWICNGLEVPAYKCEKGRYKKAMKESFVKANLFLPLGGCEYGEDIAKKIDFYTASKEDAAFKHFRDELRSALQPFIQTKMK